MSNLDRETRITGGKPYTFYSDHYMEREKARAGEGSIAIGDNMRCELALLLKCRAKIIAITRCTELPLYLLSSDVL